jgi:membrane protein DedA with SNARE-associated domain
MNIDTILTLLKELGLVGLFIFMFLEGSSLPFPGIVVVLSYGYALSPSIVETVVISLIMSIIYSAATFIPYMLGSKSEALIRKKFGGKLSKAQAWFIRYGMWSISLSRPFAVGNYISYIAGISKVPKGKYFLCTFLGILPWSFIVLTIGKTGSLLNFSSLFDSEIIAVTCLLVFFLLFVCVYFYKRNKKFKKKQQQFRLLHFFS